VLYREFEELWSVRWERVLVNHREWSILQRTALSGTAVRYVGRQMASVTVSVWVLVLEQDSVALEKACLLTIFRGMGIGLGIDGRLILKWI